MDEPADYPPAPRRSRVLAILDELDPYWGQQLVVACAILIDLALPKKLTIGPTWLLPSIEGLLLIGLAVGLLRPGLRRSPLRRNVAIGLIGLVSLVNIVSLALLIHYLLHAHNESGRSLIYSGVVLWVTNVLLFGLWYWELDRGGPIQRAKRANLYPDFLFPQMADPRWAPRGWMPGLVDYLYTSLTNATAFSPTDTMPLTMSAKWLMGAQSLVSLTTLGLVVARAVNILQG
jgi:uncharacterized membrane protein